ncbi:hypothetical protein [uncultured Nitrosomonas sp.]|uniref:hypothetical protein n=1 Tax=uncultured Nitrosomonas sp. TaxID=156424 RepID=UPI0025E3CAAA|nr:hypothetical protein [uncultured Nitrosomonas sp.]
MMTIFLQLHKLDSLQWPIAIVDYPARGQAPKILAMRLKDASIGIGINLINGYVRLQACCIHKRRFKVTTDSKHKLPIAPNLLNREFNQTPADFAKTCMQKLEKNVAFSKYLPAH